MPTIQYWAVCVTANRSPSWAMEHGHSPPDLLGPFATYEEAQKAGLAEFEGTSPGWLEFKVEKRYYVHGAAGFDSA